MAFSLDLGNLLVHLNLDIAQYTRMMGLAEQKMLATSKRMTALGRDLSLKVTLPLVAAGAAAAKMGIDMESAFIGVRKTVNATEEQLLNAVKGAYVNEFTDRFKEGLDTVIGERGVKLSGGQRQRLSIARALLADPKIIILDEATSSLDTESESYIQKSLKVLMKDRTTFVIAHRLSTIQQADQILVIEGGHIVERGKHDELIDKKGRYHDLYTYQGRI